MDVSLSRLGREGYYDIMKYGDSIAEIEDECGIYTRVPLVSLQRSTLVMIYAILMTLKGRMTFSYPKRSNPITLRLCVPIQYC